MKIKNNRVVVGKSRRADMDPIIWIVGAILLSVLVWLVIIVPLNKIIG